MNPRSIVTQLAINQWELVSRRATQLLNQLSNEALDRPVAPGKNTGKYIVGHLIAIHDAMPSILGLGESKYPELVDCYVKQADGLVNSPKTVPELRQLWDETHMRIGKLINSLPEDDWLLRHTTMTDDEFNTNPLRNRLSILLTRTNHFSYHIGQLRLLLS